MKKQSKRTLPVKPKPKKTSKEKIALESFINSYSHLYLLDREHYFHPTRKWRFDYAFTKMKLAIEYEGGVFVGGGHTRGLIYGQNCEKYNQAQLMGWIVLRFTAPMIRSGQHEVDILAALNKEKNHE